MILNAASSQWLSPAVPPFLASSHRRNTVNELEKQQPGHGGQRRMRGQCLVCLLLVCVSLACCQSLTLPAGSKTHYTVEILMNSYQPTFETYLNRVVGPKFHPPINFTFIALDFTTTYTNVADGSIDFIYTNPAIYGCLEWEYGLSSLVTQTNSRQGNQLAEFGGVIFTKADRTDITTVEDLRNKKIAAASISGLGSGQSQWLVMQKIGMSLMQDPSQVVFTGGKGGQVEVVKLVAEGLIDVGFVRTDQIERMESSGALLYDGTPTLKSKFKYINTATRYSNGAVFPFEGSTDLYPEWNLAATKSVPVILAQQVQEALYDINSTSTEATSGNYVKWQQTLSYTPLINMAQRLGVMVDDGAGNSRCQTASTLYDLVVCPAGSFKKSKAEFDTGCADTGLSCEYKEKDFTGNCICKPCVYADEVEIIPVYYEGAATFGNATILGGATRCGKMEVCVRGSQQREKLSLMFKDNKKRPSNSSVTYVLHYGSELISGSIGYVNTTDSGLWYALDIVSDRVGTHVLELFFDGVQLPNSPVLIEVVPRGVSCQGDLKCGGGAGLSVACPPKQCPSGQQLQVAGCSATSGGECIDCGFFNATWGGVACVCIANFFGDGLSCSPCPSGRISNEGSSLITDCVQPSPDSAPGYNVSIIVRIAGTAASFDAARQRQFLAAMQKASPSALSISITSITEVSIGRRRLLAVYLDIGQDMLYADQASAESAAASDLTESNLNNQMVDASLGTLTVTAQPTVHQAAAATTTTGSDASTTIVPEDSTAPTWLIIVASAVGVLAVGAGVALIIILRQRWRSPVAAGKSISDEKAGLVGEKPVLDEGDLEKLKQAVLAEEPVEESKFTEEAKDLITGKAKEAAYGLEVLLCVDSQSFYGRIGLGVAGIEEEVRQFVEERGGSDAPEDVREVLELFNYIVYQGAGEKEYPNGIRDKGRKPGTRLQHFLSDPKAIEAGLKPAHVVALRMYTTSIYRFMNNPLRDHRRKRKNVACPLPVTTWFTAEGIKKLRSLNAPAEKHTGDIMRVESIGSSPDLDFGWKGAETAIAPANSTAAPAVPMPDANRVQGHPPTDGHVDGMHKDAFDESGLRFDVVGASFGVSSAADIPSDDLNKIDPNHGFTLWRGMRNTSVTDAFAQFGGTELAFMSTTSDISVAVKYSMSSSSLLFKIVAPDFMSMGADLKWLSAFPAEKVFLHPPLTHLKPTKRVVPPIMVQKGGQEFRFTVVEVVPQMG